MLINKFAPFYNNNMVDTVVWTQNIQEMLILIAY